MLKYLNTQVVFQEFPGETTLAINITGCPHHCPGCHSPQLWEDIGEPLTLSSLCDLIEPYKDSITCVGFMGGDAHFDELAELVTTTCLVYPGLRYGWYSGNNFWSDEAMFPFDYVKFGSYKKELGGLDHPTTNQMMFKHIHNGICPHDSTFDMWLNITPYFWKETPEHTKDALIKASYDNIALIYNTFKKTSLCTMVGMTTDGYETMVEPPTEEDFVRGTIMTLNGQTPPKECSPRCLRRKIGEKEWEEYSEQS